MASGVRSRDKHISGNSVLNCDGSERESFIALKKAIFSSHPDEIRLRYLSPSYLKFHILRIPAHSSLLSVLRVSMQNKRTFPVIFIGAIYLIVLQTTTSCCCFCVIEYRKTKGKKK